ncbi:2-keto-4-pentenoate hydratase [Roseitranquillus sediminis]|uniref:2-keto-4-pentenoate hydratase n=1 Tax=Roseitranquillus sediminis TaxID=2809051 RepID=UPI001D0C34CA|nr:fumarylacetoacetate hydrolase family protein [Roseitranquillus sediminis]MBM9594698.1 fumarylacetoacetate hydrolase family protein [Roseitranquillus sediminis]
MMDMRRIESAAATIRNARLVGRIPDLPVELVPQDEANAYAIQDALLPEAEIAGWKVAPANAAKGHRCAPISSRALIAPGGALSQDAAAPEVEGEVAVVIGRNLAAGAGRDELLDAISGACLAIEVLDSCFTDRKRIDPLSALADCQSNAGLVIGQLREEWQTLDLAVVRPRFVTSAGETFEPAKPMASMTAVLEAVLWLAHHAGERGRSLRQGQVVITGARVGPMPILRGQTFRLEADGFDSVAIRHE